MANTLHAIKRLYLIVCLFLCTGIISAQTDFLFVVDNSGSISPSEFDAFANIIMETGDALDLNCGSSEYAIVHYGGAFGQEYQIQNDFMSWTATSMVTRVYQDCVTSGTSNCGDDLHAAFGSIDSEIGTGLNPNAGNPLIVVIFTDADGMSQGQNNMSPCGFAACSTILPNTNFTMFMDSFTGSSSYVVGVEDTDNEGLLQQYLYGAGSYVPIDLDDDPFDVAEEISSSIECTSPVIGIAKNLTNLTDNLDGTYSVEYLLTIENFSSFDFNTLEVFDDIVGQFSGYMPTNFQATSGSLNASTSWNGTATSNVLVPGQIIGQSTTETVSVSFDFTHDGFENTVDNTANLVGISPTGMVITDDSTDGLNADPNDDDNPDEMVPTSIMLPEIASIGIAKELSNLIENTDGTYTVEFDLTIENFSIIPLSDLEVFDDIATQFSAYILSNFMAIDGSLDANGSWNGTAASNILAPGQSIAAGETETVTIRFDLLHDGLSNTVTNVANVSATTPAGNTVIDNSTDGINPDPNGDNDPSEMVPTPVTFPEIASIGIAKDLAAFTDNNDGTYTIDFLLTIENFSLIPLSDLEVVDDIVTQFSTYAPFNFNVINGSLNGGVTWDGTATSNILAAGQMIAAGETETVTIQFDVTHNGQAMVVDNTATVSATTPDNNTVTDDSTDGINPDPNDDDTPSEMVPTPVTFPEIASIGIAKDLAAFTDNNDGTYTIDFLLTVENFSLIPLSNLEIVDDVVTQFSTYAPFNFNVINGSLNGSATWDGTATSNILAVGQMIAAGETETVTIQFDVTHNGLAAVVENTAMVSATTPANNTVSDNSTDGINPDPNDDDMPNEMVPTPVTFPEIASIGIAKELSSLTENTDGTFTVEFRLTVENLSLILLSDLEVYDDIVSQFSVYTLSNFMATNGSLGANSSWDGTAGSNILSPGQSLASGDLETVFIRFDILHDGQSNTVNNIATVSATTPSNNTVMDTSTNGLNPDPNNDGNPSEMVPTPVVFPEAASIGLAKDLTSLIDNNDGTYTVEFLLTVENFSLIPLSSLQVVDDIVTQFATYAPFNFNTINGSLNGSASWDGTAGSNILANGQNIQAQSTETVSVQFDITHNGFAMVVNNTAIVTATTPTNNTVTDDSTDGLDTDPDGNDEPTENTPTPVTLPEIAEIGLCKDLTNLTNNNDGTFTVEFLLTVENLSLIPLTDLEIFDDIVSQFGSLMPTNFMATAGSLNANSGWNGTATSNVLAMGQMISGGTTETVSISFDVTHDGLSVSLENLALVQSTTPSGMMASDTSTDGLDADPNGDGNPDEEVPTPVVFPELGALGLAKDFISLEHNMDNSFTVEFMFTVENFSEFPMNNLLIFDDVLTQFGAYNPTNFMTINGSLNGNGAWDGTVTSNILASGQSIAAGGIETISVKFDIMPSGIMTTIFNTASVIGSSPSGMTYNDDSYDGTNADPDSNDNPEEDMPTPVVLPMFGMVSGTVWKDASGDGLNNNNESGIFWIEVELTDCNGNVVASGFTDQDGNYAFSNIPPGNYMLNFDTSLIPIGCDFTLQDVGADDTIDSDVDGNGNSTCFPINIDDDIDIDAGLYPLGEIGDRVFVDNNGDGIQNFGEQGLNGVIVELFDASSNLVASTTTAGNGNFIFTQVPLGFYYIKYTAPNDFFATDAFQGINQTLDSNIDGSFGNNTTPLFQLSPGETDLDVDAGFYQHVLIGEQVFFDINKNNIFDSNENGINGMPVELWEIQNGQQVKVAEQLTHHKPGSPSDDGYFKFSVPPGRYFIVMDIPDLGLVPVRSNVINSLPISNPNESTIDSDVSTSTNATPSFQINSGQEFCNIGAGYYPMATIGNRTWADNNFDGIQNANEPSLSGVMVKAYDINGNMIDSDESDVTGTYLIDYLGQDEYYLEFTPPSGYNATIPNAGAEMEDSDIDNSNGLMTTPVYQINSGDNLENVDAGFTLGVVPVEWVSFTGKAERIYNQLHWATASEINSSHFYIERSLGDNNAFDRIGRVEASGNTSTTKSYGFNDRDVIANQVYYYRLKQVDLNGNYSYSDIISVRRDGEDHIAIYPNPIVDELNIEINLLANSKIDLALYNVEGKLISPLVHKVVTEGKTNLSFNVEHLNSGTYLIQGQIGATAYSKKVIIY